MAAAAVAAAPGSASGGTDGGNGTDGSMGTGGTGGNGTDAAFGGGGGGGYYGGGGGGGGATSSSGYDSSGGGGGGGGSSLVPSGGSGPTVSSASPTVTISYTPPPTPTISTSQQPASATVGQSIADQATVSGGSAPTGTVTLDLYDNPNATGTPLYTDTATLTNGTATSGSYTATTAGTDYWVATYNGDVNNGAVSSTSNGEPVTVTPAPTSAAGGATLPPAPPSVAIVGPGNGRRYTRGERVDAGYSCTDAPGAPGLASCTGPVASGSAIDTMRRGVHQFTVVATSKDGQTTSQTVTYIIIAPSNRAQIVRLTVLRDGTIILWAHMPGPGSVNVFASAGKTNSASGAPLLQPAPNQFTFARGHSRVRRATTLKLRMVPGAAGQRLVTSRAYPVLLRVSLTYTPEYGTARTIVRATKVPGT